MLTSHLAGVGNHINFGNSDGLLTGPRAPAAHRRTCGRAFRTMDYNFMSNVCGKIFRAIQRIGAAMRIFEDVAATLRTNAAFYLVLLFTLRGGALGHRAMGTHGVLGRRGALAT